MIKPAAALLFLIVLSSPIAVLCQSDFRRDEAFLHTKADDYRAWLAVYQLDRVFRVAGLDVEPQKVTLRLTTAFANADCDSLHAAWLFLQEKFWRERHAHLHELLFDKFLFQFELPPDSAAIVIACADPDAFEAHIYGRDGRTLLDEHSRRPLSMGNFAIRLDSLKTFNAGGKLRRLERRDVQKVTKQVEGFLREHYRDKGFWLRYAKLDMTSFYNEIRLEVTDLKNEAIRDGFFEYHYARINIAQAGDQVMINWKFQGKYGSGIFFPPRQPKDYKDMELHYKDELDNYEYVLFRKLEEYLRKL
jgi:hypothetical protein